MRPTQCKHSFFFLVGETRCCWRRTKYADIPTAAHTFPTAALGLAALAIRPRNPQERSIYLYLPLIRVLDIGRFLSCKHGDAEAWKSSS